MTDLNKLANYVSIKPVHEVDGETVALSGGDGLARASYPTMSCRRVSHRDVGAIFVS